MGVKADSASARGACVKANDLMVGGLRIGLTELTLTGLEYLLERLEVLFPKLLTLKI